MVGSRTDAEVIAASLATPASLGELFDRHATTLPVEDAIYGYRRYEADDLEGHRWQRVPRGDPSARVSGRLSASGRAGRSRAGSARRRGG